MSPVSAFDRPVGPARARTPQTPVALRFVGGSVLTVVLTLAVFVFLMRPSGHDLALMVGLLSGSAVLSVGIGYVAYGVPWMRRSPRVVWTLLGGYALVGALTFLNVWVTARLMFLSAHDLVMVAVLLIFGGGMTVSVGYLLSAALSDEARRLSRAAEQVALGHLDVRVDAVGRDEIATVARSFNHMAGALAQAAEQQSAVDRMRRDLVAWAGHDLRTPLTSVRVIVEALADGVVDDPETVQRYLRTARREIDVLSLLIDDLSVLSQIDAGGLPLDRRPNSLKDLVSDTLETFSVRAEQRGVHLKGEALDGVDTLVFDARYIGRVLTNLVENALRHSPPGGEIRITLRPDGAGAAIEVVDDGPGIDASDLPRIFDRFYRGEESRNRITGGAGLGLAIAQGVVQAHGGSIGVENGGGGGSRFVFSLPGEERA